jgi:hypothetical protein
LFVEKTLAQIPQYFRQQNRQRRFQRAHGQPELQGKDATVITSWAASTSGKVSILGGVRVEETKTKGVGALQLVHAGENAPAARPMMPRMVRRLGSAARCGSTPPQLEEFGRRQTAGATTERFPRRAHQVHPDVPVGDRMSYATNIGRPAIGQLIPRTTANIENQTLSTSNPS